MLFLFVKLAVGSEDQRIRRMEVGEWAGGKASTPLFSRAPVYESKNTVSMGSMRVTRAYVTQEQPRVADVAKHDHHTINTAAGRHSDISHHHQRKKKFQKEREEKNQKPKCFCTWKCDGPAVSEFTDRDRIRETGGKEMGGERERKKRKRQRICQIQKHKLERLL